MVTADQTKGVRHFGARHHHHTMDIPEENIIEPELYQTRRMWYVFAMLWFVLILFFLTYIGATIIVRSVGSTAVTTEMPMSFQAENITSSPDGNYVAAWNEKNIALFRKKTESCYVQMDTNTLSHLPIESVSLTENMMAITTRNKGVEESTTAVATDSKLMLVSLYNNEITDVGFSRGGTPGSILTSGVGVRKTDGAVAYGVYDNGTFSLNVVTRDGTALSTNAISDVGLGIGEIIRFSNNTICVLDSVTGKTYVFVISTEETVLLDVFVSSDGWRSRNVSISTNDKSMIIQKVKDGIQLVQIYQRQNILKSFEFSYTYTQTETDDLSFATISPEGDYFITSVPTGNSHSPLFRKFPIADNPGFHHDTHKWFGYSVASFMGYKFATSRWNNKTRVFSLLQVPSLISVFDT
jgi:hypothetical protein